MRNEKTTQRFIHSHAIKQWSMGGRSEQSRTYCS